MTQPSQSTHPFARLPIYYGWIVVAIAFITMGFGVNARSAFSLLFPPILEEFQWSRAETAGSFAIGFLASAFMAPLIGIGIDRYGPRLIFPLGGVIVTLGLIIATWSDTPVLMFLSMGVMVVGGSVIFAYVGHSAFLPNWFIRRRGLAIGIAFSGVGLFAMWMMPLLQWIIDTDGWRAACFTLAVMVALAVIPLNLLFQRKDPAQLGLRPDGDAEPIAGTQAQSADDNIVDPVWANTEWTLAKAMRTGRFWWLAGAFFGALYIFYAVQVHQTKYLIEIGFSNGEAAFAFGLVGFLGVGGLLGLGYASDQIGREWVWTIAILGFILCFIFLLMMKSTPSYFLLYAMVAAQGLLGFGMSPCYAAIPAELFQGKHYGSIFGALSVFATVGGAAGPWATGWLYDITGSYDAGFIVCLVLAVFSMVCVWFAAPRKVRAVAGRVHRIR